MKTSANTFTLLVLGFLISFCSCGKSNNKYFEGSLDSNASRARTEKIENPSKEKSSQRAPFF